MTSRESVESIRATGDTGMVRVGMSPSFFKYLSAHPERDRVLQEIGYIGTLVDEVPEADRERVMREAIEEAGDIGLMYHTVIESVLSGNMRPQ